MAYSTKILGRAGLGILIVLFLMIGICFSQGAEKEYYNKGMEYALQGSLQEAKAEFEKALEIDPLYTSAKLKLRIIKNVTDNTIKEAAAIRLFKGIDYVDKGKWNDAILEFDKIIASAPNFAEASYSRGVFYVQKDQFDKAILDFNKAIEIDDSFAEAYYSRGVSYIQKGQYDQAILDFNKAIDINPNFVEAYYSSGVTYGYKEDFDQAINEFNKAIEINPKFATAYNNRAMAYFLKKEYDKSWADVHKAEELGFKFHPGFLEELKQASGKVDEEQ